MRVGLVGPIGFLMYTLTLAIRLWAIADWATEYYGALYSRVSFHYCSLYEHMGGVLSTPDGLPLWCINSPWLQEGALRCVSLRIEEVRGTEEVSHEMALTSFHLSVLVFPASSIAYNVNLSAHPLPTSLDICKWPWKSIIHLAPLVGHRHFLWPSL